MKPVYHTAGSINAPGLATLCIVVILLLSACQPVPTPALTETTLPPTAPTSTVTPRPVRLPTQTKTLTPTLVPTLASTLDVKDTDLQGVKLQFWYPHSGPEEALLLELVDEFNRTNRWGITIQPRRQNGPGGMDEQLDAAQAAKNMPDLLVGYAEQASHWDAAGGILVDLDPYVADPIWGLTPSIQQDFYPVIWSQDVVSATVRSKDSTSREIKLKRLGLPWYRSGLVLVYNQSWARELGFSNGPQTPDEFRRQACAAAQANRMDQDKQKDGTGGWWITSDAPTLLSWIFAFDGEILRADGKGYQFNTPETEQAFKFLKDLAKMGCAWQSADDLPQAVFASRRALFYTAPLAELSLQAAAMQAANAHDSWTVLPFPSISAHPSLLVYGPSLYIVQSTSPKQVAGWLFSKWLASPENQARWISANGDLPTRAAVLKLLETGAGQAPQWSQALPLLSEARSQPNLASWSAVRWTLVDSEAQLFSSEFPAENIPALLKMLDQLAAEIITEVR